MLFKSLVVLLLLIILSALASGLYYLMTDGSNSDRLVKALTWRIGLSLVLFILLLVGTATGLIQPHGIYG